MSVFAMKPEIIVLHVKMNLRNKHRNYFLILLFVFLRIMKNIKITMLIAIGTTIQEAFCCASLLITKGLCSICSSGIGAIGIRSGSVSDSSIGGNNLGSVLSGATGIGTGSV